MECANFSCEGSFFLGDMKWIRKLNKLSLKKICPELFVFWFYPLTKFQILKLTNEEKKRSSSFRLLHQPSLWRRVIAHMANTCCWLPSIFCHLLQQMPTAGRGQDSSLMGKWEMGCYQANRVPQSTNQIRKLGVCVLARESMSACVSVCVWATACKRGANGSCVWGGSGLEEFKASL